MLRSPVRDGGLTASFRFAADFPGFRGHFPGNPVLPGICLLQAFVVAAESRRGLRAQLRRIRSARFVAPAGPGDVIDVAWTERELGSDRFVLSGRATRAGERVAEASLIVSVS
jgi:3-hydroxymyristoyl/3-hydroxydecanoyl-(acyl carrier protein) dehydratase